MLMKIIPFTDDLIPAVKAFNLRLKASGSEWAFFDNPDPLPQFPDASQRVSVECFLLMDDDFVRGAYALRHQDFLINGEKFSIADYWRPISEGIINNAFGMVAVMLLADAIKRQPFLFGVGGGGFNNNLPRFLKASRWSLCEIPFFFSVLHPFKFLKNIKFLRATPLKRFVLDSVAYSGLGWSGMKTLNAFLPKAKCAELLDIEICENFPNDIDELWNICGNEYALIAIRDRKLLNRLYPDHDKANIKLLFRNSGRLVGWAVVRNTKMAHHKQFGGMHIGSLVDGLALHEYTADIVGGCAIFLKDKKVDLIVSNQASDIWCNGLKKAGFIKGPSNFIFQASPKLSAMLGNFNGQRSTWHLNRGDGDGPIHL
jgi:hypothetical protein